MSAYKVMGMSTNAHLRSPISRKLVMLDKKKVSDDPASSRHRQSNDDLGVATQVLTIKECV